MFIRLPKVFIDGDYYQLLFLSIVFYYYDNYDYCFIIILLLFVIITIIQGKDDTKLNKEING